jgi:hypothetical protein
MMWINRDAKTPNASRFKIKSSPEIYLFIGQWTVTEVGCF